MLYADFLRCTHNGTGGTGALTLAAANGYPQPTSALGSSGVVMTPYQVAEYADATFATLVREESGIGSLNLATNVLTRTKVLKTWTAGGSYNLANPTALAFGATAANIVINFGGGSSTQKSALPSTLASAISGSDVWQPFNTRCAYDSGNSGFVMSSGSHLYVPIEFIYGKPITQVGVNVQAAVAASSLRLGIYDMDQSTGGPLNLLTEFTSATQIATTATGFKSITLPTPFWMPPGFYWLCVQASHGITIDRLSQFGHGLLSTSAGGNRDILMFDKGGTYGALPALGDTSAANTYTRSAGGQAMAVFQ